MDTYGDSLEVDLNGLAQTNAFAASLARQAKPGDVLALAGDLGAGKSAFARAFIRALTDPDEDVPSPTFTLVQTYDTDAGEIWHFDLYRLQTPDEALQLGIEDAFHDAISLIEWPERLGPYLPRGRLDVHLSITGDTTRHARLTAHGDWIERLRECGHG